LENERVILGIDPGTTIMGYGVIRETAGVPEVVTLGYIDLAKLQDHPLKLKKIFERTLQLIDQYLPDEIAIESPFYGRNVQSMLKLGRAQGVAMAAGLYRSVPIFEYAPLKIKLSITGYGNSSKQQVASVLKRQLKMDELPVNLDATDGLAAALCHFYRSPFSETKAGYKTWKDYVNKNRDRLKK